MKWASDLVDTGMRAHAHARTPVQPADRTFIIPPQPAWMADAACKEHPYGAMFPENGVALKRALLICQGCNVRQECLSYALEVPWMVYGVWGGLGEKQLRRMRAARRKEAS